MAVNIIKIGSDKPEKKSKVRTLKKNKGNTPIVKASIEVLKNKLPKG